MSWFRREKTPQWTPPTGERVLTVDRGRTQQWDLNGTPWHEAPLPPLNHECYAHTLGLINYFTPIERCPCGGICYDHLVKEAPHRWDEQNTRRDLAP